MTTITDTLKRRAFLGRGIAGLGLIALNSLIDPRILAAADESGEKYMGAINSTPFSAQSQTCNLSLPGRRPVAS